MSADSLWWWWCWLFPRVQGFYENVRQFIPRQRFFFPFFFFKVEISSRKLIPLLRPRSVHSGSASRDDCNRVFPDELRVSSCPDSFPHYAWTAAESAHSDFVGSRVCACLLFTPFVCGLQLVTGFSVGRQPHKVARRQSTKRRWGGERGRRARR